MNSCQYLTGPLSWNINCLNTTSGTKTLTSTGKFSFRIHKDKLSEKQSTPKKQQTMNLFQTLAELTGNQDAVTIVIQKTADNRLAVSVRVNNTKVEDPAKAMIAPFVVSGTPEELDAEFVPLIAKPVEQSSGLQTSMENFEASQKVAQANSKKAAEMKSKVNALKEKAKKSLQEAEKLAKDKKYAEAVKVLEKALAEAPDESKKSIQTAIDTYKAKTAPDIFSMMGDDFNEPTQEAEAEPEAEATPDPVQPGFSDNEDPEEIPEDESAESEPEDEAEEENDPEKVSADEFEM